MKINIDFNKLTDEEKKQLIKALSDGLFYLICRKMCVNYFELKKKLGL